MEQRPCWEANGDLAGKEPLIPVRFMEPRGSLQEAISGPYPKSDESSLHPQRQFLMNPVCILTPVPVRSILRLSYCLRLCFVRTLPFFYGSSSSFRAPAS